MNGVAVKIVAGLIMLYSCGNTSKESENTIFETLHNSGNNIKVFNLRTAGGSEIELRFLLDGDDTSPPFYYTLKVFRDGAFLISDEAINEYQFSASSIKLFEYDDIVYVFCRFTDRPDPDKWRVISMKGGSYMNAINLNADEGINFTDVDNDGMIEFGGFPQFYEAYCLHCDSSYYVSNIIYQIGNTITLDSILTMSENIKRYGNHIDFTRADHVIKTN